jgi:hypothetical protein
MAFTQNINPTFPKQPQGGKVQILNATGTANVTAYTAGTSGSKVVAIMASSTDTSGRDIAIKITNGGTDYVLGTKTVAANSGFVAGTPAVNLLDPTVIVGLPTDSDGNKFLYLISGDTLTANSLTTVTAAKAINIVVVTADF